jgi:hypothetical protein
MKKLLTNIQRGFVKADKEYKEYSTAFKIWEISVLVGGVLLYGYESVAFRNKNFFPAILAVGYSLFLSLSYSSWGIWRRALHKKLFDGEAMPIKFYFTDAIVLQVAVSSLACLAYKTFYL